MSGGWPGLYVALMAGWEGFSSIHKRKHISLRRRDLLKRCTFFPNLIRRVLLRYKCDLPAANSSIDDVNKQKSKSHKDINYIYY